MPRVATKFGLVVAVLDDRQVDAGRHVVACVNVLLVSSASKIALFGSTVTVFVIVPDRRRRDDDEVDASWSTAGRVVPPVQVTTLVDVDHAARRSRRGRLDS